jgi:ParB/RepB/Spo0J family partition protein
MTTKTIDPNFIDPNPYQPATRLNFCPDDLADLSSIKTAGILQTPAVRPHPTNKDRYQMIYGWRRRAAWMVFRPREQITVEVRPASDREMFEHGAIENANRKDMSTIERAQMMRQYIERFGATQAETGALFGGLGQAAVSNLLRLLSLPDDIIHLGHEGALPEHYARMLIPLAREWPKDSFKLAEAIAQADDDQRQEVYESKARQLLRIKKAADLLGAAFPPDWKPDGHGISTEILVDGTSQPAPACKGCPHYIQINHTRACLSPTCMIEKKQLWINTELVRLMDKYGIPIATETEVKAKRVTVLDIDYSTEGKIAGWLKSKRNHPACLVLVPNTGTCRSAFYHHSLLGSDVVLLGTTDPTVLRKKAAEVERVELDGPETDAQRKTRLAAEEKLKQKNRSQRCELRKSRHDIAWLIFNTAAACANQVKADGAALYLLDELNARYCSNPAYTPWTEYHAQLDALEQAIENATSSKKMDELHRQHIIVRRAASAISGYKPEEQFNWTRAMKKVTDLADQMVLRLPAGWDQPPVHKTSTNCHVCGMFSSMDDHLTKIELAAGWRVDDGTVTCSNECRLKLEEMASNKRTR